MKLPPDITDFHTHNLEADHAIISMPEAWVRNPALFAPRHGAWYAAGIHPWWTADAAACAQMLANLPQLLHHPQVIMLGECGLDALRGAPLNEQEHLFAAQIALAEQFAIPVTLHVVRAYDRLLHWHKALHPTTLWTVHGFRGKPALTRQLLQAGLDLSFGIQYNSASWEATPVTRRHRESD